MSLRKNLGMLVLAGFMVLGSGCVKQISMPTIVETPATELQTRIEREIRKHDKWIEGYIQQDYTKTKGNYHVSLRIESETRLKETQEIGLLGHSGAYDPSKDVLFLPMLPESSLSNSINSINHELWHAFFDGVGKRGLYYHRDSSVPSLEEITQYTTKRVSGEDFLQLRETLEKQQELNYIRYLFKRVTYHSNTSKFLTDIISSIFQYLQENSNLQQYLEQDDRDKISKQRDKIYLRSLSQTNTLLDLISWFEPTAKKFENLENFTLDQAIETREKLEKYNVWLETYQDLIKSAREFRREVWSAYDKAEEKYIDEEIKKLRDLANIEANVDLKNALEAQIEMISNRNIFFGLMLSNRMLIESSESLSMLPSIMSGSMSDIAFMTNKYKISQILKNPDEVMARIIDSLYSLHFGPVTQNYFPLNDEDLRFLGRFTENPFQHDLEFAGRPDFGEKYFRKGIEKYRLGLKMIKDGIKPEEVKRQLEYATSFEYQGSRYQWPEARFSIKGKIPVLESVREKN